MDPKPSQSPSSVERKERIKLNILIADDDSANLSLLEILLQSSGHKVTSVENGQLLIDKLLEEDQNFDLVISDNTMPEKTGIEALREIRSIERLKMLSFILDTTDTSADGSLEKEVNQLGGFFLPKPFTMDELSDAIKHAKENKA